MLISSARTWDHSTVVGGVKLRLPLAQQPMKAKVQLASRVCTSAKSVVKH